jgi:BirA family transcriptional regulator, biotin operon repressor / biotin---[acetyl-CoA-carboxylase] ligase
LRSSPFEERGPAGPPETHSRELADALERVRPRLGRLGSPARFLATTRSTNDDAAAIGIEGAVVVAEEQTAGRGRRGRAWFSPPGSGLYVSVVLMPRAARVEADRATAVLTLAAGVALVEGVEAATGLRADLKWPNDLYVARRKLGGILAEADMPAVTLGYGINVGPSAYPPELGDRATSLETELGRRVDRPTVFAETLAALARRYDDLLDGRIDAILDAWRSRAPAHRGALVSWTTASGELSGTTAGIDERGALLVRMGNRVERIVAGELKWQL